MDDELLSRYLRQNKPRRDGSPGSFSIRFLVFSRGMRRKPRRVEIGLGTNRKGEAVKCARLLLMGLYALGARFSGRIALLGKGRRGGMVRVVDALSKGGLGDFGTQADFMRILFPDLLPPKPMD